MWKKIMKLGMETLILGSLCFGFFSNIVKADETVLSDYAVALNEKKETILPGEVTLYKQNIKTLNNGVTDPTSSKYFYNYHTVQWVDFNTSTDCRVVTYSGSNADKWKQMTTRQAATEWEKNNPGWIVVAGINGDFFENSGACTYQPTNNFMQNGDMYRAEKSSASYRNNIGFKSDGSVIVGDPKVSNYVSVKKIDENNNVLSSVKATKVNAAPSETGLNVYTKDCAADYDLTGYTVYVGKYEICRVSTGGYIFVKGTFEESRTTPVTTKPALKEFYVASKDGSVEANFAIGDYVKCEYSYLDDWADVDNSIGYVYQILNKGERLYDESTDDFAYITHPRTTIGFKENGDMVFMVVDGRGTQADMLQGVSFSENAELLKIAGCVDGYNLDGGGSSTLIVRNEYGDFEVVNTPSDGSERSDGNHCLVVMRDPGFKLSTSNSTYNTGVIDLNVYNQDLYSGIKNAKLTINGNTYDLASQIIVPNLTESSVYDITLQYDSKDIYDETKTTTKTYHTKLNTKEFEVPNVNFNFTEIGKSSLVVNVDCDESVREGLKNIVLHFGDTTFQMDNKTSFKCTNLLEDTEYEFYAEYTYHNDTNNKDYSVTTPVKTIKTTNYDIPEIVKFEVVKDKYVTINYEYKDRSKLVTKAYILVNNEKYELDAKLGTMKFKDLDYDNVDYSFKLVIEYNTETETNLTINSEVHNFEKNNQTPVDPVNPSDNDPVESKPTTKKGCKKNSALFVELMTLVSILSLAFYHKKRY